MDLTGPRFHVYEFPSNDTSKVLIKDLSDRFYSENESICPLISMKITRITTFDGKEVP